MEDRQKILLFGPTGTGKSSFIKTITKSQFVPKIGCGKGYSTTTDTQGYEWDGRLLIDTSGLGDAQLRKTDGQIRDELTVYLMENYKDSNSINALLVFESLQADTITLYKTIESLQKIFGEIQAIAPSVVVVYTKFDQGNKEKLPMRLQEIENIVKNYGFQSLKWQNEYEFSGKKLIVGNNLLKQQIDELNKILAKCPPIPLESVKKLKAQIEALAKTLEEEYVLSNVEKKKIQIPTQKFEPYEENVQRMREKIIPRINESYQDVEKSYMTIEYEVNPRQEMVTVPVTYVTHSSTPGPSIFQQILGCYSLYKTGNMPQFGQQAANSSNMQSTNVSVPITQYDLVKKEVEKKYMDKVLKIDVEEEKVQEPYTELVTKYRATEEIVEKEIEIGKSKPDYSFFYEEAKKSIMQELKQNIKRNMLKY